MSTDEDDMDAALERARAKGGADTFGVVASLDDSPDEPDVSQSLAETDESGPNYGPVEPPPPTPDDVAPEPDAPPEKGFEPYAPTPAAKDDGSRAAITDAIRGISSQRYQPSAGLSDDAIAKARSDRQAQVKKNDLSRAISSWLMRKPFEPTPPEDTASDMLTQRRGEQSDFEKNQQQQLSASALLAKALKGEKAPATPGALSEFQKYEMDRNARLEAEKRDASETKKETAAEQLERDRVLLQKDFPQYDLSKADEATIGKLLSLRHAKAAEAQAAATLSENKTQHITQNAGDLAKALGDPAVFQSKYDRLMQLKESNGGEIPGLGVTEGVRQQPGIIGSAVRAVTPSSDAAIEGRKLIRQLAAEYARSISGAGVSEKERERLDAAGVDANNDDSRIAQGGLETLKEMYEAKVAAAKAGARPEAIAKVEGAPKPAPRPAPGKKPPPAQQKLTPGGKPYFKRQVSPSTKRVRYLDAAGVVIEESNE